MNKNKEEKIDWISDSITVDIGVHTACAVWKGNSKPTILQWNLSENTKDISNFLHNSQHFMQMLIEVNKYSVVYLEGVEYWGDNLRSRTSAVKGDLTMLSYQLGVYASVCFDNECDVIILPASKWKGQLNKTMMNKRLERFIPTIGAHNQHCKDAIAMGLSISAKWCTV